MRNRRTGGDTGERVKRTREDAEQRAAPVLAGLDNVQNVIAVMLRGHQQLNPAEPDIWPRGGGFSIRRSPQALSGRKPLLLPLRRPQIEAAALRPHVFHCPPVAFK